MKKRFCLSLTLALFAANMVAHADSQTEKQVVESNSTVSAGGHCSHVSIKPEGSHSLQGTVGGVQASYQYKPLNFLYAALQGAWDGGSVSKDAMKRNLSTVDLQERLGYTFGMMDQKFPISIFVGLGFRHLSHHIKFSGRSVDLDYNTCYIPVGLLGDFPLYDSFSIGFDVTWMPQICATVKLDSVADVHWSLKKGCKNFKIGVPLVYTMTSFKGLSFGFKPYYELWEYGATKAKTKSKVALGLPKNTYNYWGADLNVRYAF